MTQQAETYTQTIEECANALCHEMQCIVRSIEKTGTLNRGQVAILTSFDALWDAMDREEVQQVAIKQS